MQEKETSDKPDFVKWFSELDKDSGNYAGGKGANLAEIFNLKIPVPPGFVVTAQAYDYFLKKSGLNEKIAKILSRIDYEDTNKLDVASKEIRELILQSPMPKDMEQEILESYGHLDIGEEEQNYSTALDILKSSSEPPFVAVRSSATAEDLADASFAGQQDSYLNVKGNSKLILHVKKCFASLFTSRATYYRNKKGFEHLKVSLAVVVQKMVDSQKSGVMFTKDPVHKNDNVIIEAVWGLGTGIVSGKITPDKYVLDRDEKIIDEKIANKKIAITRDSGGNEETIKLSEEKSKTQVLKDHEIIKLSEYGKKLEEHYGKPQDIEFALENNEIFIVQTRPITTIAARFEGEGKDLKGEVVLTGLAASPGIAVGKIKIIESMSDLQKIGKGDVLVTKMTNPDMVVEMQKSVAIVTDKGGMTAHAAIVSREMGIPCIVGTQEATTKLKEGEVITVDGNSGKVYKGKVAETVQKEVLPVDVSTKTKIKVIVDLPSFAKRASQSGIKQVGLTRIEGIIAESGKHPEYFLKADKIRDYEDVIFEGINGIAKYFEEIWVRTSDIRSDEFSNLEGAPKEKEANPMLGFHGIRYSLKNLDILKAELRALKRVANSGKKIGLLLPQVILVEEVQKVKEVLKEISFLEAKVGVMVETPAAVQIIKELCEEGLDFISFGTNDLTQYILAVDRGNSEVQSLYNEMHPAVLYQLEYVIRVCKRKGVESSICGQAGSKKEMVKFLVEKGIDSISVNADAAHEIAKYVKELEDAAVAGTDEEPRNYQPEEKKENMTSISDEDKTPNLEKTSEPISFVDEVSKGDFQSPQNFSEGNVVDIIKENIGEGLHEVEKIAENVVEDENFYEEEIPEIKGLDSLEEKETLGELLEEENEKPEFSNYEDAEKEPEEHTGRREEKLDIEPEEHTGRREEKLDIF